MRTIPCPLTLCQQHASKIAFSDLDITFAEFGQDIQRVMASITHKNSSQLTTLPSPPSFEAREIYQWSCELLALLECGHKVALKSAADPYQFKAADFALLSGPGLILKTSGTSSTPKLVYHPLINAVAAAQRFESFYGELSRLTWQLNLPLHHVGGLSLLFRALTLGHPLVISADRSLIHPQAQAISLVPTQLVRHLENSGPQLSRLSLILIGGAPVSDELKARASTLPISYSYGLTESFAAIGATPVGAPGRAYFFNGIQARLHAQLLELKGPGLLAGLVKDGHYQDFNNQYYPTLDLARLLPDGSFEILGRSDQVIISGGEKIDLSEVETHLQKIKGLELLKAIGVPSIEWGEMLVIFAWPISESIKSAIADTLTQQLGPHYRPKFIFCYPQQTNHGIKLGKSDFIKHALTEISATMRHK